MCSCGTRRIGCRTGPLSPMSIRWYIRLVRPRSVRPAAKALAYLRSRRSRSTRYSSTSDFSAFFIASATGSGDGSEPAFVVDTRGTQFSGVESSLRLTRRALSAMSSASTLRLGIVTRSALMFDTRIGTTAELKFTTTRAATRGCISSVLLNSRSRVWSGS